MSAETEIHKPAFALAPRCAFYVRTAVPGGFTYDPVELHLPGGAIHRPLIYPPQTGDLIDLDSRTYRVVERAWGNSAHGSANWPLADPHPKVGPLLDLIVEPADGPFRDEVVLKSEEEAAAYVISVTISPGAINAAVGLGIGAAVSALFWFVDER